MWKFSRLKLKIKEKMLPSTFHKVKPNKIFRKCLQTANMLLSKDTNQPSIWSGNNSARLRLPAVLHL